MPERKYSVTEIDRMRSALSSKLYTTKIVSPYGHVTLRGRGWIIPTNGGDNYPAGPDLSSQIEDQLRSYMLNGTEPEELENSVREWMRTP